MSQHSQRRLHSGFRARLTVLAGVAACCLAGPTDAVGAPDTTITARPAVAANDNYARFDFSSNSSTATFECSRDGALFTACLSPKVYTGLTDGTHNFAVQARDATGTDPSPATFSWPVEPLNGMGLGLAYVNRGNYIWANDYGTGSNRQLTGDVTGDGRDDAVVFYRNADAGGPAGRWLVARSNGNGFDPPRQWLSGLGSAGLQNAMLGDVDGDGDADIVAVDSATSDWYVALSKWANGGTGFNPPTAWTRAHGVGSTDQLLADVTGDGRADAVVYYGGDGSWFVRAANSTGTAFPPGSLWRAGFGAGATARFAADATGDGAADAIVFNSADGSWEVAPSCAELMPATACGSDTTSFGTPSRWVTSFGNNGAQVATPLVGDVGGAPGGITGDGKADAVVYRNEPDPDTGEDHFVWLRAVSTGTSFATSGYTWKQGHVARGAGAKLMLGNVDGNLQDAGTIYRATDDPVVFENQAGDGLAGRWKFIPGEGKEGDPEGVYEGASPNRTLLREQFRPNSPQKWNRWQADAAGPYPNKSLDVNGWRPIPASPAEAAYPKAQYDEFDEGVLAGQLEMGKDAQVDFFVVDESNDLNVGGGYLWNRAVRLCQVIQQKRLLNARYPRMAVMGGSFGGGTPTQVQKEAHQIWDELVSNDQCGAVDSRGLSSGYMKLQGKPLLVLYLEPKAKKKFTDPTDPSYSAAAHDYVFQNFTVRWHQGAVEDHPLQGQEDNRPPDFWNYFGMVWWDGSIPSSNGMAVMPGWKRQFPGRFVERHVQAQDKEFYDICGWRRVIWQNPRPDLVMIGAYNDYGERTAVAPTHAPTDAGWYNNATEPDWYWKRTQHWTALRKAHDDGGYGQPANDGCDH